MSIERVHYGPGIWGRADCLLPPPTMPRVYLVKPTLLIELMAMLNRTPGDGQEIAIAASVARQDRMLVLC